MKDSDFRRVLCVSVGDGHLGLDEQLRSFGWRLDLATEPHVAMAQARSGDYRCGAVFVDEPKQLSWLDRLCRDVRSGHMEWIALAPPAALEAPEVVEFVAERCFDYHTLPADIERFENSLGHAHGMAAIAAAATSRRGGRDSTSAASLVGEGAAMKPVLRTIAKFAWSDLPVLIIGENGSGKEHVARALHANSRRASGPFVAVNCAALTPSLMQSELFGHEKGAFTGAHRSRVGRIEAACGGTILLDEVGDLPEAVQVGLLRFLEQGAVERVGSTEASDVDVRVVAATHVNLEEAVVRGKFREDLYYRLNVLRVQVPPLRRRHEDLPILASEFLECQKLEGGLVASGFSSGAMHAMLQHNWPGNVRELRNRVTQAAVLCEHRLISRSDLGLQQRTEPRHLITLKAARDAAERQSIMASLEWADGNVARAAEALGLSRVYLNKLIERHQLPVRRTG